MKKLLLVLPVLLAFGLFLAGTALAQEGTPSAETEIYTPKLLPDSPFYFLKGWKEKIELFLAQTPEAQAEKQAEFATRRVAEAKQMVKKNKLEFVEKLMEKHRKHLEKAEGKIEEAKEKGRDVERALVIVTEATSQHLSVLTEVYEKVPEQAKGAIEHAMEVSSRGQERALEAISAEKREELRQHLEEKIERKKTKIKEILEKRLEKTEEREEECLCITLWEPVCGVDGKTYTNECWLKCAGIEKAHDGQCKEEVEPGKLEFKIRPIVPQ